MRVLVIGLNPSPASAERGVNFARNGNRFWPAALASRLVSIDRDPEHALQADGIGFTDLAKRTTRRAAELEPAELQAGADRLARLVGWLRPRVCLMVGLSGWRLAIDATATAGWQPERLGPCPTYLMPNTSGLNAHARPEDFVAHLRAVVEAIDNRPR
jgi:TDG/mug DNA glycosylase family protein